MNIVDIMPDSSSTHAGAPWQRRRGVLAATGALAAGVGILALAPGDPNSAPGDGVLPHTPRSASFSLVATDWWEPPPPPPPPEPTRQAVPEPEVQRAPRSAPQVVVPEPAPPPPSPPPPPPQLALRLDEPITAAFVSIVNNENRPVGCTMHTAAIGGPAAMVNYAVPDNQFTVTGSAESRIPAGSSLGGPRTGSLWRLTVNCDNGLTTSLDATY